MAFYDLYEGIGIARKSDDNWATELIPVTTVEESLVKTPWFRPKPRPPGSSLNPVVIVSDTKNSILNFIITGQISTVNSVTTETKRTNLKNLYGYGSNNSTMCTLAIKNLASGWETYNGLITKLTFTRTGGEQFYKVSLSFLEGVYYTDAGGA